MFIEIVVGGLGRSEGMEREKTKQKKSSNILALKVLIYK